jgi:flavin-dependent dehydrogenase
VVIVGGGPAGLAVAGALCLRGRSVVVYEKSTYDAPRAGETIGAEAFEALRAIGAWSHIRSFVDEQIPLRAVLSAWGSGTIAEKSSMLHPLGEGRHVDRVRFDSSLAEWARSVGAEVALDAGPCTVERTEGGFVAVPARGAATAARAFVDASGRGAPAGAKLKERRWLALDRQIAIVARLRGGAELGFDLLLEAAELGYWYSVPQANGLLIVALVTDSDLARSARTKAGFFEALGRAAHTARRCVDRACEGDLRVVRADSGILLPEHGDRWWAAGDAAFSTDPLSGNGVSRALRGALPLVERIDAELAGTETSPSSAVGQRFADYLDTRASYYALESRWPNAPFWARRRPAPWRDAAIHLSPETLLEPGSAVRSRLARVEALIPPRAIAKALRSVRGPTPAHLVLETIREASPLGDKRCLIGLEMLIDSGALDRSEKTN